MPNCESELTVQAVDDEPLTRFKRTLRMNGRRKANSEGMSSPNMQPQHWVY